MRNSLVGIVTDTSGAILDAEYSWAFTVAAPVRVIQEPRKPRAGATKRGTK